MSVRRTTWWQSGAGLDCWCDHRLVWAVTVLLRSIVGSLTHRITLPLLLLPSSSSWLTGSGPRPAYQASHPPAFVLFMSRSYRGHVWWSRRRKKHNSAWDFTAAAWLTVPQTPPRSNLSAPLSAGIQRRKVAHKDDRKSTSPIWFYSFCLFSESFPTGDKDSVSANALRSLKLIYGSLKNDEKQKEVR